MLVPKEKNMYYRLARIQQFIDSVNLGDDLVAIVALLAILGLLGFVIVIITLLSRKRPEEILP